MEKWYGCKKFWINNIFLDDGVRTMIIFLININVYNSDIYLNLGQIGWLVIKTIYKINKIIKIISLKRYFLNLKIWHSE